jgi:hypothetical protein
VNHRLPKGSMTQRYKSALSDLMQPLENSRCDNSMSFEKV